MLRRTLLQESITKEPPQIKSLFRKNYESRGKVCKVLVDSCSTKNFISLEMVEKIQLRRVPHLFSYKVSWLDKGQKSFVDEHSWVEFQIGSYKDKFLFDVVKMDACHLLLGRPYKYDLKAQNDNVRNTYTITKDGKVI